MKKLLVSSALAGILLLLAWAIWPESPAPLPTPPASETIEPAKNVPPEPSPDLSVEEIPTSSSEVGESSEDPAAETSTRTTAFVPPAKSASKFDPDARGGLSVFVRDPEDQPVVDAEVRMTGLHCSKNPRPTHEWIGEPSTGRTGADGSVRLLYPKWIDRDRPTTHLAFRIDHPDFNAFEAQGFPVDSAPRIITLQRGSWVIVTGWIDTPSDAVLDVTPHMSPGASVAETAWSPLPDGRLACAIVPPGRHSIFLSHKSASRGSLFSEVMTFDLGPGERKELHLKLAPSRGLKGKFDDAVPRPVIGGRVLVNFAAGSSDSSSAMMTREFGAEVRSDGTFEFESLPPGGGQIIGICNGWASERVPSSAPKADPRLATLTKEQQEKKLMLLRDLAMVPQWVDPAFLEKPFELAMERTATLHATIVDTKERSIENASVRIVPNVNWSQGQSTAFMNLTLSASSDGRGSCTIENVPRGVVFVDVQHQDYVLPAGSEQIQVELEAGRSQEIRVVLEPRQDEG